MAEDHPQNALDEARREINGIDREMAGLFARRMAAVARIAAYKKAHGLPICNSEREAEVLESNAAYVDAEIRPYYQRLLENMMAESRRYQHRLIDMEEQDRS